MGVYIKYLYLLIVNTIFVTKMKGMIEMKTATMIKSVATIAAAGTVAYMISSSSPSTRRKIKRTTGKALHSFGNVFNDISSMM